MWTAFHELEALETTAAAKKKKKSVKHRVTSADGSLYFFAAALLRERATSERRRECQVYTMPRLGARRRRSSRRRIIAREWRVKWRFAAAVAARPLVRRHVVQYLAPSTHYARIQ